MEINGLNCPKGLPFSLRRVDPISSSNAAKPRGISRHPLYKESSAESAIYNAFSSDNGLMLNTSAILPSGVNQSALSGTPVASVQKLDVPPLPLLPGITINRNGVDISSELSKAFVAVEARQMIPTFVGIPLHLNLHTSLVTRAKVHCTLRTDSSIWNFFKMTGMSGDARVTPRWEALVVSGWGEGVSTKDPARKSD